MNYTPLFDDRRRSPRYEVAVPAEAVVYGEAGATAFAFENVVVRNVSREGLMLSSESAEPGPDAMVSDVLARGRSCRISCRIPGTERVSVLSATIRWAGCVRSPDRVEYRIGGSLDGGDTPEAQPLAELVAALESGTAAGDVSSDPEPLP